MSLLSLLAANPAGTREELASMRELPEVTKQGLKDVAKGSVAGVAGIPGDLAWLVQGLQMAATQGHLEGFGEESKYGTDALLRLLNADNAQGQLGTLLDPTGPLLDGLKLATFIGPLGLSRLKKLGRMDEVAFHPGVDKARQHEIADYDPADGLRGMLNDHWQRDIKATPESAGNMASMIDLVQGSERLSDSVSHDVLFAAYPELQKFLVGKRAGDSSFFSPQMKGLSIGEGGGADKQKFSLLHEIQHAVDSLEGRDNGSSSELVAQAIKDGAKVDQRYRDIQAANRDALITAWDEVRLNHPGAREVMPDQYDPGFADGFGKGMANFDAYERTSGEVRANQTGERRWMDIEERRQNPPGKELVRHDLIGDQSALVDVAKAHLKAAVDNAHGKPIKPVHLPDYLAKVVADVPELQTWMINGNPLVKFPKDPPKPKKPKALTQDELQGVMFNSESLPGQGFTSAKTSINQHKLPSVFSKLNWQEGHQNLDVGGGRFDNVNEFLQKFGATNHVYDPFNRSPEHNDSILKLLQESPADSATLSNVLNVIDNPEARRAALEFPRGKVKKGSPLWVSIYEGDRSGVGRQTAADSWQENRKLADYLDEVRQVYPDAEVTKGMILATILKQGSADLPTLAAQREYFRHQTPLYPAKNLTNPTLFGDHTERALLAESRVADESPLLKAMWGVTRADLADIARAGRPTTVNLEDYFGLTGRKPTSASGLALANEQNAERLVDAMRAAMTRAPRLTDGMLGWYVQDPMYHRLVELFNGDTQAALKQYNLINTTDAAYSPMSDVMTELARAASDRHALKGGRRDDWILYGNEPEGSPDLPAGLPSYITETPGAVAHDNQTNMVTNALQSILQGAPVNPKYGNPYGSDAIKVPNYRLASGVPEGEMSWDWFTGDAHFARAAGFPDVRNMVTRKGQLGFNMDSMSRGENLATQDWYRNQVAGPLGLQSTPAQALQWGLYGPMTGVETLLGAPKLELRSDLIGRFAKNAGISPEEARDLYLLDELPPLAFKR